MVKRGTSADGPFTDLATVAASELLTHTDTPPKSIWSYRVTALGSGGASASSGSVRASVSGETRLSMPLNGMNGTGTVGTLLTPAGSRTKVGGTLLDGATWGEGRLNDKAVEFDGKAAGLQLPPGIFSGLDDLTVSLWAYANSLRWDSCLFFAGHDGFSYMRIAPKAGQGLRFGICGAGQRAGRGSSELPAHTALGPCGGHAPGQHRAAVRRRQ